MNRHLVVKSDEIDISERVPSDMLRELKTEET